MKKLAGRRRRRTRNEGDEMKRGRERRDRHGIRILNHSRPPAAPLSLFLPFSQRISPPQMVFSPYYSLFLALSRVGNECPCPRRSTPIVGRIPKSLFVGLCIRRPDSLGEERSRALPTRYPCPVPYIASSCVVRFQSIMCCVEYLVIHSLPPPVSPSIEFVNSSSR